MQLLREVSCLPVPATIAELGSIGLGAETITQEIRKGYELGITNLLAGIATVRVKKSTNSRQNRSRPTCKPVAERTAW